MRVRWGGRDKGRVERFRTVHGGGVQPVSELGRGGPGHGAGNGHGRDAVGCLSEGVPGGPVEPRRDGVGLTEDGRRYGTALPVGVPDDGPRVRHGTKESNTHTRRGTLPDRPGRPPTREKPFGPRSTCW